MRITLALLASCFALWALPAAPAGAPAVKVGVVGPFSGLSAPIGIPMRNGVRLAAARINSRGGVLGRPLALVERDDEASPEKGVQIAKELVKEGVVSVVGFVNSGVALAAQQHFQDAKIPVMTNVATAPILTRQFLPPQYPDNYIFRNAPTDAVQAEVVVDDAVAAGKFRKVAVLADVTASGQEGRKLLENALAARGITPVAVERFKIGEANMHPLLERARAAGAEILLCWSMGPELAAIAGGRAQMGWQVPMAGGWTLAHESFVTLAGANANGVRMPLSFLVDAPSPAQSQFIDGYLDSFKGARIPSPAAAAQGYDSLLLMAAAITQANSTEGPRIHTALENLDETVHGIVTAYRRPFSPENHEAVTKEMMKMGEVRDGAVVGGGRPASGAGN